MKQKNNATQSLILLLITKFTKSLNNLKFLLTFNNFILFNGDPLFSKLKGHQHEDPSIN